MSTCCPELACGHRATAVGDALCEHLRSPRENHPGVVRWYTGKGSESELLCNVCTQLREQGEHVVAARLCDECFRDRMSAVGPPEGRRGAPEIRVRPIPFSGALERTTLPQELARVVDFAPVMHATQSCWLLLTDQGEIVWFDADAGDFKVLAQTTVPDESHCKPWAGHSVRRCLHASDDGAFAAVVNDYGRFGEVLDLAAGRVTMALDGGDYHQETVPFGLAFARVSDRNVVIHRTAWNRLDVSDPETGSLLTTRGPTSYGSTDAKPPHHYLDYFHGGLHVSPQGTRVADDGWIWHPVGVPVTWALAPWVNENPYESEDGPSRLDLCMREYYWNKGCAWIDECRIAIEGIGEDDAEIAHGARIFDSTSVCTPSPHARGNWPSACELTVFAGPRGVFFSDGTWLYASNEDGLSRWDVGTGDRTGQLAGFSPSRLHRGAREFAQLANSDGIQHLVRWQLE